MLYFFNLNIILTNIISTSGPQLVCHNCIRDAMPKQFSESDLCSDGRVIRMWVRILATTVVLNCVSEQDT